jgi:hypothetical protein
VQDLDLTVTIHLGGRIPRFGEKQRFWRNSRLAEAWLNPLLA